MNNNFYQNNNQNYVECTSHGACSISPSASSLQEVMLVLLRQEAFYVLKLDELGVKNDNIILYIIEELATIDSTSEYAEEQILDIYSKHYINVINLKKEYKRICKEQNKSCEEIKSAVKFSPNMRISHLIQQGEKTFLDKYNRMSKNQKELSDILLGVIKGICSDIVMLSDLGKLHDKACNIVLNALNLFNLSKMPIEKIREITSELININKELLQLIYDTQTELYGEITEVEVSLSTTPGKAILVAGSNLKELHSVLLATQDKNIDVYSNGNLLIAHAFPEFQKFKNFKGHFGSVSECTVLDLSTFPGAILLTKNEAQNVEYLYRGRLFTTDNIPPKGVVRIEGDDFTPLIFAAEQSKGFSKGQTRKSITVGFNPKELDEKFDNIAKKFNNHIYKHLFIIEFSSNSYAQEEYFKKFYAGVAKHSFIISFSYKPACENSITINIANNYPTIYYVLTSLGKKIELDANRLFFFLTRCDVRSLSNMISLKEGGVKNIYLTNCPPKVINPSVLKAFIEIYDIKQTTSPKKDIESIFNMEETDE